jgi:hypothetical protein
MRVTVTPLSQPSWAFSLMDGSGLTRWPINGEILGTLRDGLDGWLNGVAPKYEAPDIPGDHGSYSPDEIYLSSRILTIRGVYRATRAASSVSASAFADRIAALIGEYLTITVEDAAGVRTVEGFVSAIPAHDRRADHTFLFTLIITCPDPLKYGREVLFPVTGSTVTVDQPGTGRVFPRVLVSGPVTVLDVQVPGYRVRWVGEAPNLDLDFRDAFPLSGGVETGTLVWSQVFRLPPGESTIAVESDGDVQIGIRPGWK